MTTVDLGYAVARANKLRQSLELFTPSDCDPTYVPAQYIALYGRQNLTTLRDLCNELIADPTPSAQ